MIFWGNEIKIYYNGGLNTRFDNAIEKVLNMFGYRRWASGMEFGSGVRDLCFEKKQEDKHA